MVMKKLSITQKWMMLIQTIIQQIHYQPGRGYPHFEMGEESPIPHIITLNCACYGGGATVHAPVIQTGVQAQVDYERGNYASATFEIRTDSLVGEVFLDNIYMDKVKDNTDYGKEHFIADLDPTTTTDPLPHHIPSSCTSVTSVLTPPLPPLPTLVTLLNSPDPAEIIHSSLYH